MNNAQDINSTDTLSSLAPLSPLMDKFGREITYLRVSITDRCNQSCSYCRSPKDNFKKREDILSFDEITRVIRVLSRMGIRKVRLTGGEPLVRKNSTELVSMISKISAIEELTMTTNATLLETHATELKAAGLKRINISLDTIDKERYKKITGGGDFDEVVRGIKAALDAGLTPVRVNTVILKGINDDQLPEIVDFANELGLTLRFIECMPMRDDLDWKAHYLSIEDVLKKPGMSERVDLSAVPRKGKAAAFFLPLKSGKGEVGFISPMSDRFCESCNRLRLTADGKIRSCLPTDLDVDIKDALKLGADDKRIEELIREAVLLKPELGEYNFGERERKRSMSEIGG